MRQQPVPSWPETFVAFSGFSSTTQTRAARRRRESLQAARRSSPPAPAAACVERMFDQGLPLEAEAPGDDDTALMAI